MDLNQLNSLPPVIIGVILGLVGWVIRRSTKSGFWRALGLVLIIAAIAIVVSEVIGFPLLWTILATILGFFEWLFTGIAFLCRAGKEYLQGL